MLYQVYRPVKKCFFFFFVFGSRLYRKFKSLMRLSIDIERVLACKIAQCLTNIPKISYGANTKIYVVWMISVCDTNTIYSAELRKVNFICTSTHT